MLYKYLIVILLLFVYLFNSINISFEKISESKYIDVEIKGNGVKNEIVKINKFATLEDLLKIIDIEKDADLSKLSLNSVLYNNQIIVINKETTQKLISLNNATKAELIMLPGIGENLAANIIDYRVKYGFNDLVELKNVKGIGDKKYEILKEYICL